MWATNAQATALAMAENHSAITRASTNLTPAGGCFGRTEAILAGCERRLARTSGIASPINRGVIDEILIARQLARSGGVRYSREQHQTLSCRLRGPLQGAIGKESSSCR